MPETTMNYGLVKPAENDYYSIEIQNNNMDLIDLGIKAAKDEANSSQVMINNHEVAHRRHNFYAADSGATDDYIITIDGINSYSQLAGVPIYIKCLTANTTTASVNINNMGSVSIVRGTGTTLSTGEITAGKIIQLVYDGMSFQLLSQGVDTSQVSKSEILSNKTLTTPKIVTNGYISDENSNEQIRFIATTNAVNEIAITNAAASSAPSISATGGDANVSLNLISKGTGTIQANGKAVATKSSSASVNLAAASWTGTSVPYTYTVTVSGVTATSNQELMPNPIITLVQLQALQKANIIGYSQSTNAVVLRAWGAKPTIDIPVVFTVRGDS